MIIENQINVKKTARYYSIGKLENDFKKIWFVFHGYGQLAKDFIKNFESISDSKTLIIAPEAFNKFYVHGFNGKIGSAWMTKEDRENEINDYVNMIKNIYDNISREIDISKTQVNILGFSQGGHTAARWISKSDLKIKNFYLWGSGLPRDIEYKVKLEFWNSSNLKLIVGNKDKFITKEMLEEEMEFLKSQKINYELITYEGDHSINEYFLNKIDKHI
jgi:predicted esterase